MIVYNRIDSRLIHGQVIEAWVPHLHVNRVVVADDEAAADPLTMAAFSLAVPPDVQVVTSPVERTDFRALDQDSVRTLVLFRTVKNAVLARGHGLPDGVLNVGNVHAGPGTVEVSRSVYLTSEDSSALAGLREGGMRVVIQALPADVPRAYPAPAA